MEKINRVNIFGTYVSITHIRKAPSQIISLLKNKSVPGYMCLSDGYVLVQSTKNKDLKAILNNSLITFPDGSPLVIYLKLKGIKDISTISGYWLVKELLVSDISHYFYGSSPEELLAIKKNIEKDFPKAKVLGYKSPPWVNLEEIENNSQIEQDIKEINALKPEIVWIGMNSPKQDYLMAAYSHILDNSIMIGIGGVYDYLSGTMKISPEWVKKLSLRWVYRIVQNPKRIWKKAIISIFGFSWLVLIHSLGLRKINKE